MTDISQVEDTDGSKPRSNGAARQVDHGGACAVAIAIAGAFCDRQEEEIAAPSRSCAAACEARHIAIYLAHVVFQCPLRVIAAAFSRDRTSIAHALRKVEDRRDDPAFDALLARMERLAGSCRQQLGQSGARLS